MKYPTVKYLALPAIFTGLMVGSTLAHAQGSLSKDEKENSFSRSALMLRTGGESGGGGDAVTESRIREIREDILKWIGRGGAQALDFSKSRTQISYAEYLNGNEAKKLYGMNTILVDGAVVINSIHESEQNRNDEELNTDVNGFPKTCKGFISKKDQRPHILCNIDRFWELKPGSTLEQREAEQYRQIHHEYAGLGGLEKNLGSDSDTSISDQLTGFLEAETILRLAVKAPQNLPTPKCTVKYEGNDADLIEAFEAKGLTIVKQGKSQMQFVIEAPVGGPYTSHAPAGLFMTSGDRSQHAMEFALYGPRFPLVAYERYVGKLDIAGNDAPGWEAQLYSKVKKAFLKSMKRLPSCKTE